MRTTRSMLVSWLLGASDVAVVTFSFEALSAREAATATRPVAEGMASSEGANAPICPAMEGRLRCPATGVTAGPAATSTGRCPATGATASPAAPSDRCPAAAGASRLPRPGLRV